MEGCRPATADDLPRLAELVRAAVSELAPLRGGEVWRAQEARNEPLEHELAPLLSDPRARVLAGTIDGFPVGYAVARIEQLTDGSTLGVIDDIFVEEEARGVGVGEAMIADLLEWCASQGCRGIDAMALPGHRASKNFFEGSGFTARKLVMARRAAAEPSGVS